MVSRRDGAATCDLALIYFRDVLALGAERARPKLATMRVAHDLGTANTCCASPTSSA
jgi:hypothetical protein